MKKGLKLGIIAILCFFGAIGSFYIIERIQNDSTSQTIPNEIKESIGNEEKTMVSNNEELIAMEIFSKCDRDSTCTIETLMQISQTESKESVLAIFNSLTTAYGQSGALCHSIGHHLGGFLYGFTGNFTQALLLSDHTCGGSIYHGVVQNYFETEIFFEEKKPEDFNPIQICKVFEDNSMAHKRWNCAHGAGHGLSIAYNYDIVEAVKRCEEFEIDANFHGCNEGVFMENFNNKFVNWRENLNDDLSLLCYDIDEKFAGDCHIYQGSYILIRKNFNFTESFSECDKIKPEKFIGECYFGIGKQGAVFTFNNFTDSVKMCETVERQYKPFCISGSAHTFAEQAGIKKTIEFCEHVEEPFKKDCYWMIGNWIFKLQHSDQLFEIDCSQIVNSKYIDSCQMGYSEIMKSFESKTSHKT